MVPSDLESTRSNESCYGMDEYIFLWKTWKRTRHFCEIFHDISCPTGPSVQAVDIIMVLVEARAFRGWRFDTIVRGSRYLTHQKRFER